MTSARRLAVWCAALAAGLGAASAAYQRIADARDRRRFPPPGRMVDIGGRRLHLVEAGAGTPVIVVVPALASNVLEWLPVVRGLAGETRICVYDRAGVGWSDPPPRGRLTVDGMAADLHGLLQAAGVSPPYLLTGHSMGGVIARRFAARYPDQVAGLLLIDSSHEDQARRLAAANWREGTVSSVRRALRRQFRILGARRLAAGAGLLRDLEAQVARVAPREFAGAARAIMLSTRQRRISVRELLILARPQGRPPKLGSLPLTVLTAGDASRTTWRGWPTWSLMQEELAGISTDSRHVHAANAGHNLHLDDPGLVIDAAKELLRRS